MFEIKYIKGPLEDKWLQDIANLYGIYDQKYASLEHCRHIFNDNPYGYSLHVFVIHDSGEVVGHHAMVPIEIVVNGSPTMSGKTEAIVVKEESRRYPMTFDGKKMPIVFALSISLHRFAFEHGTKVLHLIASDDIASIHRRNGFMKVIKNSKRYVFLIEKNKSESRKIRYLANALRLFQNTIYRLLSPLTNISNVVCINGQTLDESILCKISEHMSQQIDEGSPYWAIKRTPKVMQWYLKSGLLQVVMKKNDPNNFAVLRRSSNPDCPIEVIAWRTEKGAFFNSLCFINRIIKEAYKQQAPMVIFLTDVLLDTHQYLEKMSHAFGFISKTNEATLYIKTDDPFYKDSKHLRYNPLFHTIF